MAEEPQAIVSDADLEKCFYGNFGSMTPRHVVAEGVAKYAFGYTSGHTQLSILLALKLVHKPPPGSYRSSLTRKGARYLRAVVSFSGVLDLIRMQHE